MKFIRKKWESMSVPAKASLVLMFSNLMQKGMAVLTSPIYTRLLSTAEYGQVSLFFSWYDILIVFTGLCLSKGVFNNGMMDYQEDRETFTFSLFALSMSTTVTLGLIVTGICAFVYNFIDLPIYLIVYMFVLLAMEEGYSLWLVRQRFEYRYAGPFVAAISMSLISPICGIVGILLFDNNPIGARIIGARNVFIVVHLVAIVSIILKSKCKIKTSYWKYSLKFNLPLLPHYLSLHILNHMDRIMISSLVNDAAAGIYSVAYSGSSIIKIFWQSVNASLIPWTYKKCEKKDYVSLNALVQLLILLYAILCVCFMVLAPEIMKILAPSTYEAGIYVIPSVVAGVFFSSMYYIFANVIYYYKKPKYVMYSSCFTAGLNVVLNYIFIQQYGFIAAGYTTMVCYMIQAILDYFAMRHVVKCKVYKMKHIVVVSLAVVAAALVMSSLKDYLFIRLGLLAVMLAVVVIYIKKNKVMLTGFFKKK